LDFSRAPTLLSSQFAPLSFGTAVLATLLFFSTTEHYLPSSYLIQ
jgi:hypothetical protein